MPHDYSAHRQQYTLFSYKICESAFRDNQTFSSEIYRDSPGVQSLGRTILEMVGDEHRRYRNVVQPMFLRPKVASWRSEEHTSALQSLLRISYAVFCLQKKTENNKINSSDTNSDLIILSRQPKQHNK